MSIGKLQLQAYFFKIHDAAVSTDLLTRL